MKLTLLLLVGSFACFSQARVSIRGKVFDARTKELLPFATIGVKGKIEQAISQSNGSFELLVPQNYVGDSLLVTYLGYSPFLKKIPTLPLTEDIYLEESFTLLEEVVITHAELNIRKLEKDLRAVRGKLYAVETEVTNEQYNLFLASLAEQGQQALRNKCDYNLSNYDKASQFFFHRYVTQYRERAKNKDSVKVSRIGPHSWGDYPAVNVPFEGAQQYCQWLTDQYNSNTGRKKFKKVKFRLPTLQEWQIAALGYDKFQTWALEENSIEVLVADDSLEMTPRKGIKKSILVGKDVLYPWYGSYYYRRSPQNHKGCFLANFKIDFSERPCPANLPAYDGWSMMARVASYFPNNIGLYDVIGNVAEMIAEKGKACGGSWDERPCESTIHSVKNYSHPDATIGFRVFMEVLE
jgi:formylglycine-generating enzyme required for sulfatase activity